MPYLVGLFGGDKNPAVVTSHALHRWALRHMGEPPVVSLAWSAWSGACCSWAAVKLFRRRRIASCATTAFSLALFLF